MHIPPSLVTGVEQLEWSGHLDLVSEVEQLEWWGHLDLVPRHVTADEREVALPHRPRLEELASHPRGLLGQSDAQHAGGGVVQLVHGPEASMKADAGTRTKDKEAGI